MLQQSRTKIFVYDSGKQNFLSEHFHDLDEIATYTTDNIYQLYQYTRALKPKVLIFNIKDESSLADLQSIINTEQNNYPLIVLISPQMQIPNFPQIAHYILRDDKKTLLDIIESYCLGGKKHDILLLDTYSKQYNPLKFALLEQGYSIFEVHNIDAAKLYLSQNKPRIVGIEYTPTFIPARHTLLHNHIFYVDRAQDITEIKKFLH